MNNDSYRIYNIDVELYMAQIYGIYWFWLSSGHAWAHNWCVPISNVSSAVNLRSIRRLLDCVAAETPIHAFISSRLDYCNSLLIGLPICELDRLQRVQNVAARILTFTRRREHIRSVLYLLHWLPVSARIQFKVVTMTCKCLHCMASEYVIEPLHIYRPPRVSTLRYGIEIVRAAWKS